ncbi:MAG TPA: hypothetical protein EYQ24_15260 [Bacteroidetes bacterium]|nr:hypothetical protein [Bacteroidota bacterium]
MRWLLLGPGALLALLAAGCDTTTPYACTLEFRSVSVSVVDPQGRLLPGLEAQSIVERTGEVLSRTSDPYDGSQGQYVVASDAHLEALSIDGEEVVFTATGEGVRASARFILADDGCHVQKEEGPAQITAEAL